MQVGIAAQVASSQDADFVREAERFGAASVWVPEAWGQDAFTPLAYLAARTERIALGTGIAQLGARSPANLAMSAMSMQQLSGGRFRLGIGTSGPQVMEGWHGVSFDAPLAGPARPSRLSALSRPATGLATRAASISCRCRAARAGRSARLLPPTRCPSTWRRLGPRNLELTGELADGWIGNIFMPEHAEVFLDRCGRGPRRQAGRWRTWTWSSRSGWRSPTTSTRPSAAACPRLRVHDRRYGLARPELLQRRFHPAGLRRGRPGRTGPVAGGPARRGRRPGTL